MRSDFLKYKQTLRSKNFQACFITLYTTGKEAIDDKWKQSIYRWVLKFHNSSNVIRFMSASKKMFCFEKQSLKS